MKFCMCIFREILEQSLIRKIKICSCEHRENIGVRKGESTIGVVNYAPLLAMICRGNSDCPKLKLQTISQCLFLEYEKPR